MTEKLHMEGLVNQRANLRKSYALELIDTGEFTLINTKLKSNVYNNNLNPIRSCVVYCLHPIRKNMWLPLNRDYKPLGLMNKNGLWADYEEYEHLFIPESYINFDLLWDNGANAIFARDGSDRNVFYVFSDMSSPWTKEGTERYITIIRNTFYKEEYDTYATFKDMWGYKKKNYKQDYQENLKRFETEKNENE